jgi:hypothetical protein
VASFGFARLPRYFSEALLASARVVLIDRVPKPPLASMGLSRFEEFQRADNDGITYLDTFFVKRSMAAAERLHFHELIHVVQWRLLGPEMFLAAYAAGLETYGYWDSPLETMAYKAEASFTRSRAVRRGEAGGGATGADTGIRQNEMSAPAEREASVLPLPEPLDKAAPPE